MIARTDLFRRLPSLDELLRSGEVSELVQREGHAAVANAARRVLERVRAEIAANRLDASGVELAVSGIGAAIERELNASLAYSLRPVINATGVVLHTNLGRAPVAAAALDHLCEVAGQYSNLEFDLERGERGKRDVHVDRLFRKLLGQSGVEHEISTVVVNNNAAAVLIALNTLGEGGEVVVSRGELVEIGGSFRIPDVMAKSGAVLREVGTTNRTRLADYERAINERTKLLLRVHRSNFQIVGFTEQPSLESLVELGQRHGIPVMEDLGSGVLFDLRKVGVHGEPDVFGSLHAGVDVVTYSGDKLLGGPQAGVISGRKELVGKIRSNPLFRALRVDKLTYAALEATLLTYVKQDYDAIPALRMMRLGMETIEGRAQRVIDAVVAPPSPAAGSVGSKSKFSLAIIDGQSVIGGGSAPGATLPTKLIAFTAEALTADQIADRLRASDPPIIARVENGQVLFDLRTVLPEQDEVVARALRTLVR
jgi:L-seryl-tRNA(Ser) seleniumtransferase